MKQFLDRMFDLYEVIFFTASIRDYGTQICDNIDPYKRARGRLFREHCLKTPKGAIKDLYKLGRELSEILIVDN